MPTRSPLSRAFARRAPARAVPALLGLAALAAGSAAALDVPVDTLDGWTALAYRNIDANEVSASADGLRIAVDGSAGPLVYRLAQTTPVHGFTVHARWNGSLRLPDGATQGDQGADDFVLRFGLVEAGEQTLNWFQRRLAADWVLTLFRLAPAGSGVARIDFYSTTQQASLVGRSRIHPLSDLLRENWIQRLEGPGEFTLTHQFDTPVPTLGLWISSDGDDTGSQFELEILNIELDDAPRD